MDPNLTANIETDTSSPAPANTTSGPHRLTFVVPYHDTIFSLGKGSPDRIAHDGITGRTKDHIHFRVTEGSGARTFVSMGNAGGPLSMLSYHGTDVGAALSIPGYTMLTAGRAFQASREQHTILSSASNVVVRSAAKGAMLQADVGPVDVFAATQVTLASPKSIAIVANSSLTPETHADDAAWSSAVGTATGAAVMQYALTAASFIADGFAWHAGVFPINNPVSANTVEWCPPSGAMSVYQMVKIPVDFSNAVFSGIFSADSVQNKGSKPAIGMGADYIGMNATYAALLYAHFSSSIAATVNAGVVAGYSVSIKAPFVGILAAKDACVVSVKDVQLEGTLGTASVRAKKDVQVTSSTGPVVVQAKMDARLSSESGMSFVHGNGGVLCTAGSAGFRWGALVHRSGVSLGALSGSKFEGDHDYRADFDKSKLLKMNSDEFEVRVSDAYFALRGRTAYIASGSKAVELKFDDSGTASLQGTKFHIG